MKRTLTAVFLTALLTLSLCACGQSGTETADVDLASLGQELTALCGEDLYELDSETITMLYGDTATAQALVWSSSGTTADEVALFQAEDADGAAALLSTAQQRIADRAESYADYMPDEAAKLDKAIAEQHGTYVVVCVCSQPEKAQSILDEAFGS